MSFNLSINAIYSKQDLRCWLCLFYAISVFGKEPSLTTAYLPCIESDNNIIIPIEKSVKVKLKLLNLGVNPCVPEQ